MLSLQNARLFARRTCLIRHRNAFFLLNKRVFNWKSEFLREIKKCRADLYNISGMTKRLRFYTEPPIYRLNQLIYITRLNCRNIALYAFVRPVPPAQLISAFIFSSENRLCIGRADTPSNRHCRADISSFTESPYDLPHIIF